MSAVPRFTGSFSSSFSIFSLPPAARRFHFGSQPGCMLRDAIASRLTRCSSRVLSVHADLFPPSLRDIENIGAIFFNFLLISFNFLLT